METKKIGGNEKIVLVFNNSNLENKDSTISSLGIQEGVSTTT